MRDLWNQAQTPFRDKYRFLHVARRDARTQADNESCAQRQYMVVIQLQDMCLM
jgi:hypothetical protein